VWGGGPFAALAQAPIGSAPGGDHAGAPRTSLQGINWASGLGGLGSLPEAPQATTSSAAAVASAAAAAAKQQQFYQQQPSSSYSTTSAAYAETYQPPAASYASAPAGPASGSGGSLEEDATSRKLRTDHKVDGPVLLSLEPTPMTTFASMKQFPPPFSVEFSEIQVTFSPEIKEKYLRPHPALFHLLLVFSLPFQHHWTHHVHSTVSPRGSVWVASFKPFILDFARPTLLHNEMEVKLFLRAPTGEKEPFDIFLGAGAFTFYRQGENVIHLSPHPHPRGEYPEPPPEDRIPLRYTVAGPTAFFGLLRNFENQRNKSTEANQQSRKSTE